jgi:uncharacterized protein YbjT (DUF2867 family)
MAVAARARRVFATGGTRYLGSRLLPQLLRQGHGVRAMARRSSNARLPLGCEAMTGTLLACAPLQHAMAGGDAIHQVLGTLLWTVGHLPESIRIPGVPHIRSRGGPRP